MKKFLLITAVLLIPFSVSASTTDGTIDTTYKYSRICHDVSCTTYGTVNWLPTLNANTPGANAVHITSSINGNAWGDEIGWVNLSPAGAGVSVNQTTGVVTGKAYSSVGSWIIFNPTTAPGGTQVGVTINSNGEFSGWAWVSGINGGWMKFDCSIASTCVKTDWRPTATPPQVVTTATSSSSSSSGSGGQAYNFAQVPPQPVIVDSILTPGLVELGGISTSTRVDTQAKTSESDPIALFYKKAKLTQPITDQDVYLIKSYNEPLTVTPQQQGLLVWDFGTPDMPARTRGVIIEVPPGLVSFADKDAGGKLTFAVSAQPQDSQSIDDVAMNVLGKFVFDVTAHNSKGEEVHTFNKALKITLVVPESLRGRDDIHVFYQEKGQSTWTKVPNVVFGQTSVSFYVDHLTRFAIMTSDRASDTSSSFTSPTVSILWLLVLLLIVIVWLLTRKK